ncbi:MAG: type II secretion system F family protein [Candidatus Aenigmatarchaeota archaeon]
MTEEHRSIPIVPFPMEKALSASRKLRFIGEKLAPSVPHLKKSLYQAEMDIDPVLHVSLAVFTGLFYAFMMGGLVAFISLVATGSIGILPPLLFVIFFFVPFWYVNFFPALIAKRRVKDLEKNLLFALRHLLIEVRAGVPLFDAMVGVSNGYGTVSEEFRKIVEEVNSGRDQEDVLNEAAKRSPSLYFRRALWQVVNALQGGSDVSKALEAITDNFADRQINKINRYGEELNPWTMFYMIIAVILPSIGITFLIILTSLTGMNIPGMIFPLIIFGLAMFQFFFMGFVKSKRPSVSF